MRLDSKISMDLSGWRNNSRHARKEQLAACGKN